MHVHISVQYMYASLCTLPSQRLSHQWILLSGDHAKMCQVKLQESEHKKKTDFTEFSWVRLCLVLFSNVCTHQPLAPNTSWVHINYATGRLRGNIDTAKGMLDRHFGVNSGHRTMWTGHIIHMEMELHVTP